MSMHAGVCIQRLTAHFDLTHSSAVLAWHRRFLTGTKLRPAAQSAGACVIANLVLSKSWCHNKLQVHS